LSTVSFAASRNVLRAVLTELAFEDWRGSLLCSHTGGNRDKGFMTRLFSETLWLDHCSPVLSANPLVYRITFDRTGSFDDSLRIELASAGMTWRLNTSIWQTVDISTFLPVKIRIFACWKTTQNNCVGMLGSLAVLDDVVKLA